MKKRISHGYINARIIDDLNSIGYFMIKEFFRMEKTDFNAVFVFESKYIFGVNYRIKDLKISKNNYDKAYYGTKQIEFTAIRHYGKTLQELFEEWLITSGTRYRNSKNILPNELINSIRESIDIKDIDHDKMLMKGHRFNSNEKVKRHAKSNSKEDIEKSLYKCAWMDYYEKFENQ